jgi:CheY-like chemotaxis protein
MPIQTTNVEQLLSIVPEGVYELASGGNTGRNGQSKTRKNKDRSPKADGPRRVLVFGRLFELALYRAEVLRTRGYSVITPKNKVEAIAVIQNAEFDAVVLSYTLSSETAEELMELVRQKCPGCPLITISDTGSVDRRLRPDIVVPAKEGPAALIKALQRAFRTQ